MPRHKDQEFRKAAAQMYVDKIKAGLACVSCGALEIEFHNEEHIEYPHRRVSNLVSRGESLEIIDREIRRCTPICRSCHMQLDGRMDGLLESSKSRIKPPEHCIFCNKLDKRLRDQLCARCYRYEYILGEWPKSDLLCKRGHYKIGDNLYIHEKSGFRHCVKCRQDYRHNQNGWPTNTIVCKWGHYLLGENLGRSRSGKRYCKQCSRERAKEWGSKPYYRTEEK